MRVWLPLLLVALFVPLGHARPAAAQRTTRVTMDFKDVDIEELVKTISKLTGRNFMIDERVRGKVTIISPTPLSIEEAYRVFLAALEFRNLTIVQTGPIYKVVPLQNAIKNPTDISSGKGALAAREQFVTRIVQLSYVDANEVSNLLKQFSSSYGTVVAYPPTNLLIIGDTALQINRMLELLESIDVEGSEQAMEMLKLENISAQEAARIVQDVFAAQAGATAPGQASPRVARRRATGGAAVASGSQVRVIPIDALNSVIVIASSSELADVKALLAKLDVKPETAGGTIHVYYLSYANAEELSSTLAGFAQQGAGGAAARRPPAGQPGQQGAAAAPAVAEFEGGIKITPDKRTNSLIIISSPGDYNRLREIIRKLDIPRSQVYVEAVIMEVSVDKVRELGLAWHSGTEINGGDGVAFGGQALGGLNTLSVGTTGVPSFSGLFLGALAKPIDFNGVQIFGLGALLRALQTDDTVNILSTPNILTSDNEDAEIVVGQNVPFITGQTATTGGNVLTSIERQDVGITLKITPQINAGGKVKLKLEQEISSVQASAPAGLNVNQQGLITRKRSAKTTVVVKDRQTVVIGGLMSDELSRSEGKIPVLGDIPVLGWFFRASNNTSRKTNLLIFLTPYVVTTREEMQRYSDKREEFFHRFREDAYVAPLNDEYTFRRTYGPIVGDDGIQDEVLFESEPRERSARPAAVQDTAPSAAGGADRQGPAAIAPAARPGPVETAPPARETPAPATPADGGPQPAVVDEADNEPAAPETGDAFLPESAPPATAPTPGTAPEPANGAPAR